MLFFPFFCEWFLVCISKVLKGTHPLNKIFWYMKHLDPLSTVQVSKNSSNFWNTLKNAFEVQKLVLTRGRLRRQWPHIEGRRRRQWLQIEGRIWCQWPHIEGRQRRQWLQIEGRGRRQLVYSLGPWESPREDCRTVPRTLPRALPRTHPRTLPRTLPRDPPRTHRVYWLTSTASLNLKPLTSSASLNLKPLTSSASLNVRPLTSSASPR